MKINGKSTRYHERTKIEVPVTVIYHADSDETWQETTLTEELTICGGGFVLSHSV